MKEHDAKRPTKERRHFLDDSGNVDRIVHGLYVLCALLILGDLVYLKNPHFEFEGLLGFYGFFGFLGSVGLVLLAKQLRRVLMRDEDHYGDTEQVDAGRGRGE